MHSHSGNNVAIIGAGLYGLVTAKVLLDETNNAFSSITIFEKQSSLGGVWSQDRIYPGLASNSPALTYEIPGFKYPERLRKCGAHVEAEDVNAYLNAYAETFDLKRCVRFSSEVRDVSWNAEEQMWRIVGYDGSGGFENFFKFVVVCNGLYHAKNIPEIPHCTGSGSLPKTFHSADVGNPDVRRTLSISRHTVVVGAGKSAIDLATLIAKDAWTKKQESTPRVTLVYKRPHWLSPRSILMGAIHFERVLFSRFLNAWLPFAIHPDLFHAWIAETSLGKRITAKIFQCVEMDMKMSCGQMDLPETIPNHPLRDALSGALHVAPTGYLDLVRAKRISIIEGSVASILEAGVEVQKNDGKALRLDADNILWATGYKISFPFFTSSTLQQLGITRAPFICNPNDLPFMKLHRLIVPPTTTHPNYITSNPCRSIAFNGFAYSLLNPTVAYVSAHWIADYFLGKMDLPDAKSMIAGKTRYIPRNCANSRVADLRSRSKARLTSGCRC
ncbi:FAD/NAD(P)-binding domain-containing protein [Lentithecium fluviatile CBS 122367]|uniref:FAD/NAD(P)-binding domain-containing protein n=1 Tax=Lentithecium fluviatile CBS 122367 TaxID=1168545 RepID=A0A6G1J423_9PLEO|nr:FAD/NAD(P)-binding domain-containing protein [Lentithecium fluviatile CBS 122367]